VRFRLLYTNVPHQTVYNSLMEPQKRTRRPFLSRDILKVLTKYPNLTRREISIKTHAKNHSVKAVLFKLVATNKIRCEKGKETNAKTGPRLVNVYCVNLEESAESSHG
jgi:transcription initiation factor IIE alpha subunit